MKLKHFIELLQRRIRRVTRAKKVSFVTLFQRSRRQGFVTSHEKLLRGRVPIVKRVKRILQRWMNSPGNMYSSPQKNKQTKRNIFLFCAVIVCCILLFSFKATIKNQLLKFDIFLLTNVQITGCLKTTPDKIREYAQVKYNSRLFAVDQQNLQKRLEKHPWIFKTEVTRRLPDTLVIALQEYVPRAIIQLGEKGKEKSFYVDREGTPFIELAVGQDMDFPVITGLERLNSVEGLKVQLVNIMEFLILTDKDDPNLPAQSVSQLHVDFREGITLFLVDFPFPIFLGKDNIQKQYYRLKKVVGFLYKERKRGVNINMIAYIRMDYLDKKVLVAHTAQVGQ